MPSGKMTGLLLIGFVVLAIGGVAQPALNSSPPDAPSQTTPTPGTASPPGISAGRVTEPLTLSRAHGETLQHRSYTIEETHVQRYANGTLRKRRAATTQVAANDSRYLFRSNIFLNAAATDEWSTDGWYNRTAASNGTLARTRLSTRGKTSYTTHYATSGVPAPPTTVPHGNPSSTEGIYAQFAKVSNVSVTRTEDGYSLRADSSPAAITNVSFSVNITDAPLIEQLSISYIKSIDGTRVHVTTRLDYDAVGSTTVELPDWYEHEHSSSQSPTTS
jgi:hypothetical protein